MSKVAKFALVIAFVLALACTVTLLVVEGPGWINKFRNQPRDMEIGPAQYSKELQEVMDLTHNNGDYWAQIFQVNATSQKIKTISVEVEEFSNGKWKSLHKGLGIGGNAEKGSKLYISYNPKKGGQLNFEGASTTLKKADIGDHLDTRGMIPMLKREPIKLEKKNVLAIFEYTDKEEMNVLSGKNASHLYEQKDLLKKYEKCIAITVTCSEQEAK